MTEETTAEQLAEIEGQGESTPVTGYTPPEGWRVLAVGERLRAGDMIVRKDGSRYPAERLGGWVGSNQRHIRLIELEPEPQAADTPATEYTPPEGWRVLAVGEVLQAGDMWVWPTDDQLRQTVHVGAVVGANQRYIRPIKREPQPEQEQIEELRSEVSYVQRLLGESRQRVTQLEELVGSLRTINEAQEKAFEAAGKENTALRNQLAAVKTELASVAADRQRLQIELDAAQQVPADSPELRQLRADLAEVTQDRDTYRHAHELLVNDVNATHQRTKVMTIEAIVEWLVPIRTCGSQALATAVISNLPHIMRSLTGLADEEIE